MSEPDLHSQSASTPSLAGSLTEEAILEMMRLRAEQAQAEARIQMDTQTGPAPGTRSGAQQTGTQNAAVSVLPQAPAGKPSLMTEKSMGSMHQVLVTCTAFHA